MNHAILNILRAEARASNAEIGRRLDMKESDVEREIRRLEESKTILGYRAVLDPEKLDEEVCIGIIEVKVSPQGSKGYDAISSQISRFPEVVLCYVLSGDYDLLVFVEGKNLRSVSLFVTDKLATIDHVIGTTTHFILKKYKEFGVAMGGDDKAERLAVTP